MKIKFPSIRSVVHDLKIRQSYLRQNFNKKDLADGEGNFGTDCRLRVWEGGWQILTGSSDYDQTHRGFWGAGFLSYSRQNLTDLAKDLLEQAKDSHAMSLDN